MKKVLVFEEHEVRLLSAFLKKATAEMMKLHRENRKLDAEIKRRGRSTQKCIEEIDKHLAAIKAARK